MGIRRCDWRYVRGAKKHKGTIRQDEVVKGRLGEVFSRRHHSR